MEAPGFWDAPDSSNQKMKELKELKNVVAKAGYDAVSVRSEPYEKKELFGAFGR